MPIDLETLNTLRMLGTDNETSFLNRIIGIYLTSTEKHISDLKIAHKNGYMELLTRAAHNIKSSSGNIGALQLMKICEELETNCRRNLLNNNKLIESISKEFIKVKNYLENFQNTLAGEQK